MEISFSKKVVNIILRVVHFFRVMIAVIFIFSLSFLIFAVWPSEIYEVDGIVQDIGNCEYYTNGKSPTNKTDTQCLYINFKKYYFRARETVTKIQEKGIELKGHYVQILCADNIDPSVYGRDITIIVSLLIDGELIWDSRDAKKNLVDKLIIIVFISGILCGINVYRSIRSLYRKKDKE